MLSLLFYLLVLLIFVAIVFLFYYQHNKKKTNTKKKSFVSKFVSPEFVQEGKAKSQAKSRPLAINQPSPYDPKLIVLHLNAFPGKPYMGYELHQALLAAGLRFGEKGIFYRYEGEDDKGKVLFALAAATAEGSFVIEDMGSFKCNGLLLFMTLDGKQQLMTSFDLMLDTARQLAEELGGEIYDDLRQLISADVIKRLREKICTVETSNLYASDLLDNLD